MVIYSGFTQLHSLVIFHSYGAVYQARYISFWAIPDTGTTSRTFFRCRGLHDSSQSRGDHDSHDGFIGGLYSLLVPIRLFDPYLHIMFCGKWSKISTHGRVYVQHFVACLIYQHFLPSGTPEDGWYHLGLQFCRWHVIPAPLPTRQGLRYVRGTLCYHGRPMGFGERDSGPKWPYVVGIFPYTALYLVAWQPGS